MGSRDGRPGLGQPAGVLIDAEDHRVVAAVVTSSQRLVGSNSKFPRQLALRGNALDDSQSPGLGIDGEHGEAVVAAIRGVEELAVRTHADLGAVGVERQVSRA